MVNRCSNISFTSLRSHREANVDLFITHRHSSRNTSTSIIWVTSHSDKRKWESNKDLEQQQLTRDEIYNAWCDRQASQEILSESLLTESQPVTPAERWAVYSDYPSFHKLIGSLKEDIHASLGYEALMDYLALKSNLTEAKLARVNSSTRGKYIRGQKPHHRGSTVKLIHGWHPTYATLCRQGQTPSPICPQCSSTVETSTHILVCPCPQATSSRKTILVSLLKALEDIGSDPIILYIFGYKLSITLHIPNISWHQPRLLFDPQFRHSVLTAVQHQNIVGWDNFLKGFSS
jgi:hypothetical protein